MTRNLTLPDSPAGPTAGGDARISAPSALRNRDAILAELLRFAPDTGRALEIASGTGEHVIAFAPATPGLIWHPTDPDLTRLASIAAWMAAHPTPNIAPPAPLNAAEPGWSNGVQPYDLIVLVNLLHLISNREANTVLSELAAALAPGGLALIYGPFLRDGAATSAGDAAFHDSLRAQDPEIGYKDVADVTAQLVRHGLRHVETVQMPANNLLLAVARDAVGAP